MRIYMGLLRADGSEPSRQSGYERMCAGEVLIYDIPGIPNDRDIVFNEVADPGYGNICAYAAFDAPVGGEALYLWELPQPVYCHTGTIPFIHKGVLYRGLDVSAQITLNFFGHAEGGQP